MRNRRKTIESLRRLADRPGTPHEGKVARAMLERMAANVPAVKPFSASEFPRGTAVFYNYWAYPVNDPCVIVGKEPKVIEGRIWLRMRFDHLKQPRRVTRYQRERHAYLQGSAIARGRGKYVSVLEGCLEIRLGLKRRREDT